MGREQLCNLVYVGRSGTPKRPNCVADGLANLELVITHATLLLFASHQAPRPRRNSIVLLFMSHRTTKPLSWAKHSRTLAVAVFAWPLKASPRRTAPFLNSAGDSASATSN